MKCFVNNIALHYEMAGAASGSPVILVHGNGESHEIFDKVVPLLAQTHTVYAVDSRGHGESSLNVDMTYDLMADDYIAFIQKLGLKKPVFYGFSDGGIIGLLIALREPGLLGQLIVSGANLFPEGLDDASLKEIAEEAAAGIKLSQLMLDEPHIDPESLSALIVPTVVMAGEFDAIRREHTELIARSIPGSMLEIVPGENHGSYIVHSDKLYGLLMKHMKAEPKAPSTF